MLTRPRILIVDDNRAMVDALSVRCATLGLEVEAAFDGLEALISIVKSPPDLVLLDIDMPAADGLTVCERLTNDDEIEPLPAIVMTGRSDEETIQRCLSLGAYYVLKDADTWTKLKPLICQFLDLEEAVPDRPPVAEMASDRTQPVPSVPKALVIDDDPAITKAIGLRLRTFGVETLTATNGMQGYWIALKEEPDIIVTDYSMPEGSGDLLLSRLKNHAATRDIPVVVVTGRTNATLADHGLERDILGRLGASALLPKPLNFEVLVNELRRYISFPEERLPSGAS